MKIKEENATGMFREADPRRGLPPSSLRVHFLQDPERECGKAGLAGRETDALCRIDRAGLLMAAESFARKRKKHRQGRASLLGFFSSWLRKLRKISRAARV